MAVNLVKKEGKKVKAKLKNFRVNLPAEDLKKLHLAAAMRGMTIKEAAVKVLIEGKKLEINYVCVLRLLLPMMVMASIQKRLFADLISETETASGQKVATFCLNAAEKCHSHMVESRLVPLTEKLGVSLAL